MQDLFVFLVLICFLLFLLGLINPKWALRWGKNKTRKKVALYYGSAVFIFFILVGMTAPRDNLVEEKSTNIQNKSEEVISTTQGVEEEDKISNVLNNEGEVILTGGYFPIKEKLSYIWVEKQGKNAISRQNWWRQYEGKNYFNNKEIYVTSSLVYYDGISDKEDFKNDTKRYSFYEIDSDNNILKIGEKGRSGKIILKDSPEVVLFSEMEIGKKYKIKETDFGSTTFLKCLGFLDVNSPNGEIYKKCLVIEKIKETKTDGELSFIYHFINYYAKNIGEIMIEVRCDNVEDGVVKKGDTNTTYLLKIGYPEIEEEVYEYTPIEYLNLDKILKGFEELRCSIEKKNRDESGKELYTIKNELVPDFGVILWTKDNKIEQISVITPLVGGDESMDEFNLSLNYYLLTIKMFTGDNREKVIEWITSEETIGNSVYVNGEETKSLEKIFNDIKITVSHINFSDVLAVLYFIEHKDGAKKKIIKIDPREL